MPPKLSRQVDFGLKFFLEFTFGDSSTLKEVGQQYRQNQHQQQARLHVSSVRQMTLLTPIKDVLQQTLSKKY